jgi:calcineurin-like phosphoesterase family protein
LQAKLEGIKINKDVALKANKSSKQGSTSKSKTNKQVSTSKPKVTKQVQEIIETTSSSNESENCDDQHEKVDDAALFMKRYHKRLKNQGYKVVKRKFPNKKKKTCYNCESTKHFIAKCPYEIKDHKHKKREEGGQDRPQEGQEKFGRGTH